MRHLAFSLLALLLLAGGCSRSLPPTPLSTPPGLAAESGAPKPADPPTPEAWALFPEVDRSLHFILRETGGSRNATTVVERVLREGDRVIAGYDGKAYATWFLKPDGVYRIDPVSGGALLRYLPPALQSGAAWKQQSGDAEVWFSLRQGCSRTYAPDAGSCWSLTTLNRGERSTFIFQPGFGPTQVVAQNWVRPQSSLIKEGQFDAVNPPTVEERAAYVGQGVANPPAAPAVTAVTEAEFSAAERRMMLTNLPGITQIDLDGDGQNEYIQGKVNDWTAEPIALVASDTTEIRSLTARPGSTARLRPVAIGRQTWLLYETKRESTLAVMLLSPKGVDVYGWATKATATQGTRVEGDSSGKFTLWWELNDPARHLWVREYQLDPAKGYLNQTSSRFTPAEQELRYPTRPADLLYAAFVARWYGLQDELPRYFAKPESAAVLAGVKPALYSPGYVELGEIRLKDLAYGDRTVQIPEVAPGPVGPDGRVGYMARLGSYETSIFTWGQVTFGTDAEGRLVILDLTVEGQSEIM